MKRKQKKLILSKDTLRSLERPELKKVEGANEGIGLESFIQCPTSRGLIQCPCE